jgi:beta-fructofuranosidase
MQAPRGASRAREPGAPELLVLHLLRIPRQGATLDIAHGGPVGSQVNESANGDSRMCLRNSMINKLKHLTVVGLTYATVITLSPGIARSTATLTTEKGPYPSKTPQYIFATTLDEQEAQLRSNPLIIRFAKSRERLASDPYRPTYHFVSPESMLNDPNGLSYWQGRWHLFYQAYPPDEFPNPKDAQKRRQHWGHAVSEDLVHWRDLPYAIYPGIEKMAFSGSTVAEKDRVVAFYPGIEAGQMIAISRDPLLLNWAKSGPVNTDVGDSDIWKEGDTYIGLVSNFGKKYYPDSTVPPESLGNLGKESYGHGSWPKWKLWTSMDLQTWKPQGEFLFENTPFTDRYDDGSCPNFKKIGDKHILLFFSHKNGAQYFLGDYDEKTHKFRPYDHGRLNHGQTAPGGVLAPSAAEDGKGGVINILTINDAKKTNDWDQIMSLAQRLTLGEDKKLRIEPAEGTATLRGEHQQVGETVLSADKELILAGVQGNTMELNVEIDPKQSRWVQLNVLRSPMAEEETSIIFYNYDPKLTYWWFDTPSEVVLDGSRSSLLPDVWPRPPERALIRRGDETLKLRVFIDRSVVEVFVNERQYLAMRVYPGRKDSVGVSLRAHGREAALKSLDAWQMKSIWPIAGTVH